MAQTTLSVRLDDEIKRRFDCICSDIGMNASVAVNMFVRAVLREKGIPFSLKGSDDPFYSAKNQEELEKSIAQLNAGQTVTKTLAELEAMAE